MRILTDELKKYNGQTVEMSGWIHRIRDLGKVCFVILRDRHGLCQLVLDDKPELHNEYVLTVTGVVGENEKSPGGYEVQVTALKVLAAADPELPVPVNQDPAKLSLEAILDNRLVSLRTPKIKAIFRLQSAILQYFAEYLRSEDFTEIKSSKLIGSGTEGGTGLFTVKYFDTEVFLAQSPQFYKQAMVATGMERVFEIGAAYRAEKHETPRHLNEYVSLDVEMAFIDSEEDLMDLETKILKYVFEKIKENNQDILDMWDADVPSMDKMESIPRISHDEARKIISDRGGKRVFEINPEGEKLICEWALENFGIDLVFIGGFPRKKRPFYTYPKGQKTMSYDLIFRGLEITTGGRRINEYPMLLETLPRFGLTVEGLGEYPKIFKYGCPPHGGFAIGLERITQKILGLANVKEASLFPRDRKRISP